MVCRQTWLGQDAVYVRAQKVLRWMALHGHVTTGRSYQARGRGIDRKPIMSMGVTPSKEMNDLIAALNQGDEEHIKGLMLLYRDRFGLGIGSPDNRRPVFTTRRYRL